MAADATDDASGVPWATGWARTDPVDLPLPDTPDDCPGVDHCGPAVAVRRQTASLAETVDGLLQSHQRLETQVRGVVAGHQYLADQIAGLTLHVDQRTAAQGAALAKVAAELQTNTATTQRIESSIKDVADILATGRVVVKTAGALGGLAKPLGVLVLAFAALSAAASDWAVGVWHGLVRAMTIIRGGS